MVANAPDAANSDSTATNFRKRMSFITRCSLGCCVKPTRPAPQCACRRERRGSPKLQPHFYRTLTRVLIDVDLGRPLLSPPVALLLRLGARRQVPWETCKGPPCSQHSPLRSLIAHDFPFRGCSGFYPWLECAAACREPKASR